MINRLPSLHNVVKHLQQVPFLASKNLYKVVTHFLLMNPEKMNQFCDALKQAKENIQPCSVCFVWKEKSQSCLFCSDAKRDATTVCVVESWQELLSIERTNGYNGLYHLLGGAICPLDGIGPEDLHINELVSRVNDSQSIKEVILALNQTPEGEATSAFIAQKISNTSVQISCLAKGVPIGSSLEFIDRLTMFKAISDRRPF